MTDDARQKGLEVEEFEKEIVSELQIIPKTGGVESGFIKTGFIDVEKSIKVASRRNFFFLEKKLPFQVLVIEFDP